jgi:hypothetical protein
MSTPSQIAANVANAQSSTGPRTETGKAASSMNGLKFGLFTMNDFVRPAEETAYAELNAELRQDLAPVGILENNLVDEIRRAIWRLRRCGKVESNIIVALTDESGLIFDSMETNHPYAEKVQKSVDRARAQAHRLLHKCTAELRKLQTDRKCAQELLPANTEAAEATVAGEAVTGIADSRAIAKVRSEVIRQNVAQRKLKVPANTIPIDQPTIQTQTAA